MNGKVVVLVFSALACINVANAGLGFGGCPKKRAMKNFEITKFDGHWYEFSSFGSIFEANEKCVQASCTLRNDGNITVITSMVDKKSLEPQHIRGKAKLADNSGDAEFALTLPILRGVFKETLPFSVLDTDYENCALAYSCVDFFLFHLDAGWVLSRNTSLGNTQLSKLETVMKSNGLNPSQFVRQVQDCGVIACDIGEYDYGDFEDGEYSDCGCGCGCGYPCED